MHLLCPIRDQWADEVVLVKEPFYRLRNQAWCRADALPPAQAR